MGLLTGIATKIVKKEIEKHGGIEKVSKKIFENVKNEVEKHGSMKQIANKVIGLNKAK